MTLDSRQYRDPMLVLMEKQEREERIRKARSCDGCVHKAKLFGVAYCAIERTEPGETNMRRCSLYKEAR